MYLRFVSELFRSRQKKPEAREIREQYSTPYYCVWCSGYVNILIAITHLLHWAHENATRCSTLRAHTHDRLFASADPR